MPLVHALKQLTSAWTIIVPDRIVARLVIKPGREFGSKVLLVRECLLAAEGRLQVDFGRAADVFGESIVLPS